jgi:hypothetical protein
VCPSNVGGCRRGEKEGEASYVLRHPVATLMFISFSAVREGKSVKLGNTPVGCIEAKFLSPTVLKPKAVILLGNNLGVDDLGSVVC